MPVQPKYTTHSKYQVVGEFLTGKTGTFLDLGARDRILQKHLPTNGMDYHSHDLVPGHDYDFDLENAIPLDDGTYDFTAALDVLEHVDHLHAAFYEILRVTDQYAFIVLPNISALGHRLRFALTGHLSAKYALKAEATRDRHRWVTVYPDIIAFMEQAPQKAGFEVVAAYNHVEYVPYLGRIIRTITKTGIVANGLFVRSMLFILRRTHH